MVFLSILHNSSNVKGQSRYFFPFVTKNEYSDMKNYSKYLVPRTIIVVHCPKLLYVVSLDVSAGL